MADKAILDKEERLPFLSSNSENMSVRIPKELWKALEDGAKENGLSFAEYIRRLLHTGCFYFLAMGRIKELKALVHKGDTSGTEKMAEVFDKIEEYFAHMDMFVKEAKELEDDNREQRKHIKDLQERTLKDMGRILRAVDDNLPRGEAR